MLHEEFQKLIEKIRINRLSRHLYDIERFMNTKFADIALSDKTLHNEIINYKNTITAIRGINYNLHSTAHLNMIPPNAILKDWKADYKKMQE